MLFVKLYYISICRKAKPSYLFDATVRGCFLIVVQHLLKDRKTNKTAVCGQAIHNGFIKAFKENIDPRPCVVTVMIGAQGVHSSSHQPSGYKCDPIIMDAGVTKAHI